MPITHAMKQGPAGETFVRTHQTGRVTGADAKHFMRLRRVAVVVSSAPLRVMMSFVIRMSGSNDFTRFFTSELEAQRWLCAKA